jgi:hypothetical protein
MRLRVRLTVLFATAVCQAQGGGPAFPFELREGLLWVQVRTPEVAEPLNFLLDTGAGVSVLNLATARKLGLKLGQEVSVQGVGASAVGYWPESLTAQAGEISLPGKYLAVDLSELSGACKCRVDGLIGADFFCGRAVQIDFVTRQARIVQSGSVEPGQEIIPLKVHKGAMGVAARINGVTTRWLRLDTGCASPLQWVDAKHFTRATAPQVAVALSPISVGTTETTVQLGHHVFGAVQTGLHDKPIFPGESGLLGNGLLSRFSSVTIDLPAARLLVN